MLHRQKVSIEKDVLYSRLARVAIDRDQIDPACSNIFLNDESDRPQHGSKYWLESYGLATQKRE